MLRIQETLETIHNSHTDVRSDDTLNLHIKDNRGNLFK